MQIQNVHTTPRKYFQKQHNSLYYSIKVFWCQEQEWQISIKILPGVSCISQAAAIELNGNTTFLQAL